MLGWGLLDHRMRRKDFLFFSYFVGVLVLRWLTVGGVFGQIWGLTGAGKGIPRYGCGVIPKVVRGHHAGRL